MSRLRERTRRRLVYVCVVLTGGLLVLEGIQEENTVLMISGGILAATAAGLLVVYPGQRA
jgi:hypothetical protein